MYVLAHEQFNHMPADWRGWLLTNIARHPPLPSILEVLFPRKTIPQLSSCSNTSPAIRAGDLPVGRLISGV